MRDVKVFVDSDVVISSLLSSKGASSFLINNQSGRFIISNISRVELERVAGRLGIAIDRLKELIKNKLRVIRINADLPTIQRDFQNYTTDLDDAHIVAGAKQAKAKFLITYNLRHFKAAVEKLTLDARNLLNTLETNAEPRDRQIEARRAHERAVKRFGSAR